jgi:hypothetical protein
LNRKSAAITVVAFVAVCALVFVVTAEAQVRIGGWSLRANGQVVQNFEYSGPCPVNLQFGWGVMSPAPAAVSYTFTRSDGGHSTVTQTVEVGANQSHPIYDTWHLGANTPQFRDFHGWVQIDIFAPNVVAKKVPFTIHCR